jgi:hypothetical protein
MPPWVVGFVMLRCGMVGAGAIKNWADHTTFVSP